MFLEPTKIALGCQKRCKNTRLPRSPAAITPDHIRGKQALRLDKLGNLLNWLADNRQGFADIDAFVEKRTPVFKGR